MFPFRLGCTLHQHGHTHGGGDHNHSHGGHSHDNQSGRKPTVHSDQSQPLLDQSADGLSQVTVGYGSLSKDRLPAKQAAKKKTKSNNINVKAAFIHVVGDFCQSVGVLVAAIIIYFKVREEQPNGTPTKYLFTDQTINDSTKGTNSA